MAHRLDQDFNPFPGMQAPQIEYPERPRLFSRRLLILQGIDQRQRIDAVRQDTRPFRQRVALDQIVSQGMSQRKNTGRALVNQLFAVSQQGQLATRPPSQLGTLIFNERLGEQFVRFEIQRNTVKTG